MFLDFRAVRWRQDRYIYTSPKHPTTTAVLVTEKSREKCVRNVRCNAAHKRSCQKRCWESALLDVSRQHERAGTYTHNIVD